MRISLRPRCWFFLLALGCSATALANGNDVLASFDFGLWRWMNNSTWEQLHTAPARALASGDLDGNGTNDVVVSFDFGLWRWMDNNTWEQLHTASAARLITVGTTLVKEAEQGTGSGVLMWRSAASGHLTVLLRPGESRSLNFNLPGACSSAATVTYSNDNYGALESVLLGIDGLPVGKFAAQNTGSWNVFLTSAPLGPITIAPGLHSIEVDVSGGDGNGVEIDKMTFQCP